MLGKQSGFEMLESFYRKINFHHDLTGYYSPRIVIRSSRRFAPVHLDFLFEARSSIAGIKRCRRAFSEQAELPNKNQISRWRASMRERTSALHVERFRTSPLSDGMEIGKRGRYCFTSNQTATMLPIGAYAHRSRHVVSKTTRWVLWRNYWPRSSFTESIILLVNLYQVDKFIRSDGGYVGRKRKNRLRCP